ncbi:hypothetical protein CES86_3898 [Brucella lupini]|uniref:Uncharacterized protein n=1 Tax=Brucella lupini TaxID=255457 RepID=A0A256GHL8_9HYPH|nr:hypothetical protein CES86_3898 [Brucella lupini]
MYIIDNSKLASNVFLKLGLMSQATDCKTVLFPWPIYIACRKLWTSPSEV